jgi:hypothetical protein
MIANIVNTLLGLALVYCAILAPGPVGHTAWVLLASGAGIVGLALWARSSDRLKWFNLVNLILGTALLLLGIVRNFIAVPPLVLFWWVFWVGILVAVFAFWSALYTLDRSGSGEPDQRRMGF